MSHFRLDVQDRTPDSIVVTLMVLQEHPRHFNVLIRGEGNRQEHPLTFQHHADGHDHFVVNLSMSQPFEYVLRVVSPEKRYWITPKGEENDELPHNWFYWPQPTPPRPTDTSAPADALTLSQGNETAWTSNATNDDAIRNSADLTRCTQPSGASSVLFLSSLASAIGRLFRRFARTPPNIQPEAFDPQTSDKVGSVRTEPTAGDLPQADSTFVTPGWVRDAIFYQIFPERFARGEPAQDHPQVQPWGTAPTHGNFMGGNLQGILDRLDYLTDLGVTALYLTPIFQSPSNHKYDTTDYFMVDPHLGDLATLRRLVNTCHHRGLRVVLDGVFNHCSDLHPFFLDVRRHGPQSRYWDWFYIRNWPIPERFDAQSQVLHWYDCWWGFHTLPKLNYQNPEVEAYFLNVATHWLREANIDGWRLDVPNEVIQSFWPKFRRTVKAVNSDAYIVGEIWEDASAWLQGDQFDAVMNYRFKKALIDYFAEEQVDTCTFDHTVRHLLLAHPEPATAVMMNLLGSHDTARPMTVAHKRDPGRGLDSLKLMVAMQFTCAGAPCIYYGDEIGQEGDKDPDCRRCYPWGWEIEADTNVQRSELLAYYKALIAIRKANPALRHGSFHPIEVNSEQSFYAFERRYGDNHCIVAMNRSDLDYTLTLPSDHRATELMIDQAISGDKITVPARKAVIVRMEPVAKRDPISLAAPSDKIQPRAWSSATEAIG